MINAKTLVGSAMAVALLGVGVLAGSVAGNSSVSAQTPSVTPSAPTTKPTTPSTDPTTPNTPPTGMPGGMRGGPGSGGKHGGAGDLRGGPGGQAATADGASKAITSTTSLITLVKSDLAYANGKMDTTDVQKWINGADSLLTSAQSANSNSQYGQAVAYANAARELTKTADTQMAQKLGADKLPSYSQMPQRSQMPGAPTATNTTVTQAQASRVLANTYERLVTQAALVQNASNAKDATPYLTDAQNAYKTAYDAYQAGKYSDAVSSAKLTGQLAEVANAVVRAATAPANSDTPVTVPSPNF